MEQQPTVDTLIGQLHDRTPIKPDAQFQAAIELGKIAQGTCPLDVKEKIADALVAALSTDYQALTRAHAAQELGLLEEERAFDPLLKTLKDEYRLVRAYAAGALGKLNKLEAIPDLLTVLQNDSFFGARAEAAEALGALCRLYPEDARAKYARSALTEYQQTEQKRDEEKSRRVLRELFVALDKEAREVVDAALVLQKAVDALGATNEFLKEQIKGQVSGLLEKAQRLSHGLQPVRGSF